MNEFNSISQETTWEWSHRPQTVRGFRIISGTIITVEPINYSQLKIGEVYTSEDPRYGNSWINAFEVIATNPNWPDARVFLITKDDNHTPFISLDESNILQERQKIIRNAIKDNDLELLPPAIEIGKRRLLYEELPYRKEDKSLINSLVYSDWLESLKVESEVLIEPVLESDYDPKLRATIIKITDRLIYTRVRDSEDNGQIYKFRKSGTVAYKNNRMVLKPLGSMSLLQ
jgi:hypothetical protein